MVSSRPTFGAGLHWVRGEVERSLDRARAIIEMRVDDEDENADLQAALAELRQVAGTSAMIQCVGLQVVAREMCATLEALDAGSVTDLRAAGAALLGAIAQLLDYVDAVATGMPDQVLIFQPLVNELRVARGDTLLTEADLFAEQLSVLEVVLPFEGPAPGAPPATETARRYQPVFQQALATWLRDTGGREPLARIGKVAEVIAAGATEASVHELWRLVAAVAEGWLSGGLQDSLEIKRLIGRAARGLQLLANGDEAVAAVEARALSLPLVWHVGRASQGGRRIEAIRDELRLKRYLPDDEALEQARARLSGANTALLNQLSQELRNDLQQVKDAIDLVVRAGDRAGIDLGEARERLDRISNTLAMLGLPVHARVARNQMSLIATLESEEADSGHGGWLDAAAALLRIESSLDEALFRQLSRAGLSPDETPTADEIPNTADLLSGTDALLRESLVNLSRVKTTVDAWMRGGDDQALPGTGPLLREIGAVLRIGGQERAGALVDALADFADGGGQGHGIASLREHGERADRFADAVANVEYYLEAVAERRPDAAELIENVSRAIESLAPVSDGESAPAPAVEPAAIAAPAASIERDEVDPDIRDIFLEEAAEVLDTLRRELERWRRDLANTEAMLEIRRGFHTLKGSGRMVGAAGIGEFAWSCERLLNRCRDGELELSPEIIAFVEDAIVRLPALIDAFRDGHELEGAAEDAAERAERIADRGSQGGVDPELLQVFLEDAQVQLDSLDVWLSAADGDIAPDADLVRIFHTLRGSAAAVSRERISGVAAISESWLNGVRSAGWTLDAEARALLADIGASLRDGLDRDARVEHDALVARLQALQAQLPAEARDEATDRSLDDTFALEALDLLQSIEATATNWRGQPESHWYARTLQSLFQSLRGAAVTAQCAAIGQVALAFEGRMTAFSRDGDVPPPGFFDDLADLIEGIYQQLDAFRDGQLNDDGSALAARVFQLAQPVHAGDAGLDTEAPPVFGGLAMDGDTGADLLVPDAVDPELIEIFQAEAQELLEGIDRNLDVAERAPNAQAARPAYQELARALHTLKGSARMAGFNDIGEVAHRFESWLARAEQGEVAADAAFYARLHNVTDGLYRVIDAVRIGERPDLEPLFADLEEESGTRSEAPAQPFGAGSPVIELEAFDAEAAGEAQSDAPAITLELESYDAAESEASSAQAISLKGFDAEPDDTVLEIDLGAEAEPPTLDLQAFDAGAESSPPLELGEPLADLSGFDSTFDDADPAQAEASHAGMSLELSEEAGVITGEPLRLDATGLDDAPPSAEAPDAGLSPQWDETPEPEATDESVFFDSADIPLLEPLAIESPDSGEVAFAPPEPELIEAGQSESQPAELFIETPEPIAPVAPTTSAVPVRELDEELIETFREEATELLALLSDGLRRWRAAPDDAQAATGDVQRALHTLKGGARMAGLEAMGAAAHETESVVDDMVSGQVGADDVAFSQLETRLDQLQHMHDHLLRGVVTEEDESQFFDASLLDEIQAGAGTETALPVAAGGASDWDPRVFWRPPAEDEGLLGLRRELARVPVEKLESMLNEAGEVSILRARLDQQMASQENQLVEVGETVDRLRDQLRQMTSETEAQIAARGLHQSAEQDDRYGQDFDPLEMDRYSRMQELSRALAESVNDLGSLHASMQSIVGETEALLLQQQRVTSEVQQGLMGTLMVPFSRQVQRLQRVVRQVGAESGKRVELRFDGIGIEVDRNVLERMTAPLEHVLRNAVVHGIETPAGRSEAGKPDSGVITVSLSREGQNLRLEVQDDGRGLSYDAIREAAVARGLMKEGAPLSDAQVALFILEPGFSTARELTQAAGRGVGMDVVASEVRQLGGSLELESETGRGARFIMRLPITLGLTQALMVTVGGEPYAIPLSGIEGIARLPRAHALAGGTLQYGGADYETGWLADYLGLPRGGDAEARNISAILVRLPEGLAGGSRNVALVVDGLLGNREVVSKSVGPTVSSVPGMTGATILPDGGIVLLLDLAALVQDRIRRRALAEVMAEGADSAARMPTVMVVDDSITMRRVAERLLGRNGYRVTTAKDGLDAMAALPDEVPDIVLLDIEMPRADGFEVAAFMRNTQALAGIPIIMITSRSGDKHRERAASLGVDRYLIKPYQEDELLAEIAALLEVVQ